METNKIIYFVVGVDLDTGTKHIDDDILMARFGNGVVYNTDTQEWVDETQEEYEKGLAILNSPEWGND